MNPEMIDLAKRLVACRGFRWMPGMKDLEGWRLYRELPFGGWDAIGGEWEYHQLAHFPKLPDLTDPATLGCLLALVREVWGMPTGITVGYSSDEALWGVSWSGATHGGWCGRGKIEAEALVVALENTP